MEATALWDFEANHSDEMSFQRGTRLCITDKNDIGIDDAHRMPGVDVAVAHTEGTNVQIIQNDLGIDNANRMPGVDVTVPHAEDIAVQVLDVEEKEWCKAVCGTQLGLIPATYVHISEPTDWFLGNLPRSEAESYLLVRDRHNDFIYPDGAFLIRNSESDRNGFALSVKHENTVQHFKILRDSRNKFFIWPNTVFTSINELVAVYHEGNVAGEQSRNHIQLCDVELFEAAYDFTPANQEELELRKGDVIRLISKTDQNWWEGCCCRKNGYFPMNYVKPFTNRNCS